MTSYLYAHQVRIFDYSRFAQPFREELRMNAERLAAENGIEIQYLRKKNLRKEELVQAILAKRGSHPGLVPSSRPYWICTVNLSLLSLKGNAVLDSKGLN
jgi:hypothetical protein